MINCLFAGIGGFIGTVCRYLIGLIPLEHSSGFPFKTLMINITGAFLIGLITAAAAKNKALSPQLVTMLKVGICGGFTTFSTFAYETTDLIHSGKPILALVYVLTSTVLGTLAVFGALLLAK
ncbi:MAG TPA: fluoride efflux transporter CrcB [Lachnospiraceae bacterium]|nr:fluoride efflux transporter CrcB [Lachnospiraceae bacterium]